MSDVSPQLTCVVFRTVFMQFSAQKSPDGRISGGPAGWETASLVVGVEVQESLLGSQSHLNGEVDGTSRSQAYAPFMMSLFGSSARARQSMGCKNGTMAHEFIQKTKYCDIFTCHVFPTIRFCSILLKAHFWNLDIRSCQC